jgi:hypothetical protein
MGKRQWERLYYGVELMPLFYPPFPKAGLPQISGGALQWGIPGLVFSGQATYALSANFLVYTPIYVQYPHTLTAWEFEVTTGPAGAANIAVGVYKADGTLQPVGAPLYDSGSTAVANAFTGIKTATGLSITLLPGIFLVVTNVDTNMTLRCFTAASTHLGAALGATSLGKSFHISQAYGAFANPGTLWTTLDTDATGLLPVIAWQWTE